MPNFLDNIIEFFQQTFIKFLDGLPGIPWSVSGTVASFRTYLGYVNYFFPIYAMLPIWNAFIIIFPVEVAIILITKWILRGSLGK